MHGTVLRWRAFGAFLRGRCGGGITVRHEARRFPYILHHFLIDVASLVPSLKFLDAGRNLPLETRPNPALGVHGDRSEEVRYVGAGLALEAHVLKVSSCLRRRAVKDLPALRQDEDLVELVVDGVASLVKSGDDGLVVFGCGAPPYGCQLAGVVGVQAAGGVVPAYKRGLIE